MAAIAVHGLITAHGYDISQEVNEGDTGVVKDGVHLSNCDLCRYAVHTKAPRSQHTHKVASNMCCHSKRRE